MLLLRLNHNEGSSLSQNYIIILVRILLYYIISLYIIMLYRYIDNYCSSNVQYIDRHNITIYIYRYYTYCVTMNVFLFFFLPLRSDDYCFVSNTRGAFRLSEHTVTHFPCT